MGTDQNDLIRDLIVDEIRNHSLTAMALLSFLDMKGIIDAHEFLQYQEDYAKSFIKDHYPFLDVEHYKYSCDDE